jgi:tetratricopeptide (TPR) repeat protein
VAIVLVVLCIVALPILRKKHDALVEICSSDKGDVQTTLDACDLLLDWAVFDPAERSLAYRNKMRLYIGVKDWEAAKREADLAIAADPKSEVPLQWKALVLARTKDYADALATIETALERAPANDYSLEMKGKLLRTMGADDQLHAYFAILAKNYPDRRWIKKAWGSHLIEDKLYDQLLGMTVEGIKRDPQDNGLVGYYYVACLGLGPHCPPLFPERRETYPELTCSEAIKRLGEHFDYYGDKLRETGLQTVSELYAQETRWSKYDIQALYAGQIAVLTQSDPIEASEGFILASKVFDCVFPEKYIYPLRYVGPEGDDATMVYAHFFTPPLRQNLLDLAYVYLDAPNNDT